MSKYDSEGESIDICLNMTQRVKAYDKTNLKLLSCYPCHNSFSLFHIIILCHTHTQHISWACMYTLNRYSHVWLFETLWTVAHQAPLSTAFSRQEYWSGLPSSRGLSWPRDRICTICNSCNAGGFFTTEPRGKPHHIRHSEKQILLALLAMRSLFHLGI